MVCSVGVSGVPWSVVSVGARFGTPLLRCVRGRAPRLLLQSTPRAKLRWMFRPMFPVLPELSEAVPAGTSALPPLANSPLNIARMTVILVKLFR